MVAAEEVVRVDAPLDRDEPVQIAAVVRREQRGVVARALSRW